ncbi:MAG: dicarboxylate/amino acid:cation symporter [Pseudobdellovibrionaceae bacterium]
MKKHTYLILSLVLGSVIGFLAHPFYESPVAQFFNKYIFEVIGQVFLRSIFMIVVPMVFSGLVIGVYQLTSHHGLARVAKKTLFFTLLASSCSVVIGITAANLVQPGKGFLNQPGMLATQSQIQNIQKDIQEAKPPVQALLEIIPKNPIEAASKAFDGEMLALMFFSLIFGAALSKAGGSKTLTFMEILQEIYDSCMIIVEWTMKLAPFAVFALVFQSTFKFGYQILFSLGYYVLVVVGALLVQQLVVYSALLKLFSRWSPLEFFKKCKDVYLYAFATASSNATLPKSLELAEHELKLKPESSRFVLTIGSTANQNGTALFEGITVLFLAQVYGVHLDLSQQIKVVMMSVLAGVGTAGVPGGSLPLIMILTQQMGIPAEGMGLILGVDRFLDMCRTTLNVSGDLVIAALVDE